MHSRSAAIAVAVLVAIGLTLAAAPRARAQTLTTLYRFCLQYHVGNCWDGSGPSAGLVQGSNGNFYGTTQNGGWAYGPGTIFMITPTGALTTIYTFGSQTGDGTFPMGSLVQGRDGNFYGTTLMGGANVGPNGDSCGTVFKITPSGALTTLHSFCSQSGYTDGASPYAGLVQGSDGNFYGTTSAGGANGYGTVFKITPGGTLTTLYSFCSQSGCTDGQNPLGPLIQGSDGNYYGTTEWGGANYSFGTVFKITPSGALTTLYSFCSQSGCADGGYPLAGLVQGSDGNLYGTTNSGGLYPYSGGTVFQITPSGTLTTLYSFCSQSGCADGGYPVAGLTQGSDGNLYGTTYSGGLYPYSGGTVFQITPSGTLTTLYSFCSQSGCTDGAYPNGGLMQAGDGKLYGTTEGGGGAKGDGTVFSLPIPAAEPVANLSPTDLTFANQSVNTTSLPQSVTLSNTGIGLLTVSDVITSGDFAQTDNCGGSLPFGGSCTISVTFTPSVTGTRTGSLTFTDNSNGVAGSTQTIGLSGTSVPNGDGTISLFPSKLSLGYQEINTTSTSKPFLIRNTGSGPFTLLSVAASGDFAASNSCPSSLKPSSSCRVNVTFTPSALGNRTGTVTVAANTTNSPQIVTLTGAGVGPVTLWPAIRGFQGQHVGYTSPPNTFILRNSMITTLDSITISTSGDFAVSSSTCGTSLTALSKCIIDVAFTPTVFGPRYGSLSVSDSASNSPQVSRLEGWCLGR